MSLKLVALDMDGTLLNHDEVIGPRNASAIRKLQERGVVVTIATGRSFREARGICEASGVRPYIISSNGAEINDCAGERVAGYAIDRALAEELTAWLDENSYYYELTGDTDVFAVKARRDAHRAEFESYKLKYPASEMLTKGIGLEYKLSLREISIADSYQSYFAEQKNTYKIHVLSPDLARLEAVKGKFRALKDLEMVSSLDHNVEVMHRAASKGNSIAKLAETLNISLDYAMAVGDNYNDLSMLNIVKYPVAMGNAKDEVKRISRYTTLCDHEDGVAHVIEQFDKIIWK